MNLEQQSVLEFVVDGFFQNIETLVKQKMLHKNWKQQCVLQVTQQAYFYTVTTCITQPNASK